MANATITLTTDFGEDSPYVAAMKGVILGINPAARLVDLSHEIPPQDIRHAAYFLAASLPFFPAGVVHVVVVDPGVGSQRALLCVELNGSHVLVPDNGCWTGLERTLTVPPRVLRLTPSSYWRNPVSPTFHGRDILAPVAAHLSLGVPPELMGEEAPTWLRLPTPRCVITPARAQGEVVFVDHFGNLLTNIPAAVLADATRPVRCVRVGDREVTRLVKTYTDAPVETLVALISSTDQLEIALTQGHAARRLHYSVGTPVVVEFGPLPMNSNGPE